MEKLIKRYVIEYANDCYKLLEKANEMNRASKWNNISRIVTSCGNGMASSSGLGLFRTIPYSKARKSFADLQKLTKVIDDKYIMDIYNSGDNAERCADNVLLDKDGWHIHEV